MMRMTTRAWVAASLLVFVAVPLGIVIAGTEPPAAELNRKPSTYAPAKDLESQVSFFLERIREDLQDEAKYDPSRVERVKRDANTLAVLALVLGKHDENNRYQPGAAAILESALVLAEKAASYGDAKAALDKLVAATEKSNGTSANLAWKSVGDIVELMNQVPKLNTSLRGIVLSEDRFAKNSEKAAGLAASLAAIAQISVLDDAYCTDESDRTDWIELSGLMRDAAYEVNQAVRRGDQAAAKDGLKPLARTCEDCHDQFKD